MATSGFVTTTNLLHCIVAPALYSFSYIVASTKPTRWPAVYSWQLLDPAAATCLAALSPAGRGRDHHYVCIRRQPRVPSSFLFPRIKVADIYPAPHRFIRSQPCVQKRPSLSLPNCCQYLPAPSSRSSLPPFLPHQCVLDHKPWPICSQDLSVLFCAPRAICN